MLSQLNEFALSFIALLAILAAMEIGFRLGRRVSARSADTGQSHFQSLQSALLGLLSLLLGFNFVMAANRFDARKALIQEEVNAIGAVWERARLLPSEHRQEVVPLLKQYVSARIDFMRAGLNEALIDSATLEASGIEEQIWLLTRKMVEQNSGGSQVGLFIQSLGEMVDSKWKRRNALDNHVPEPVLHLLFTVAVGALGFIGYGYGLTGRRRYVSTGIYALLIVFVLAVILDFDRPRDGLIQVSEDGMVRLHKALAEHKA